MNGNGSSVFETSKVSVEEQGLLDGSEEAILSAVDDSIKETLAHEMKGYRAWKAQQDAMNA